MKYRIVTHQFGYRMWAADVNPAWSDRIDEAHLYDERDSRDVKLAYWRGYAAVCGLDPDQVRVEAA